MSAPRPALPCTLRAVLDESGLPWEVHRGRRHWQIVLAGRPVLALPYAAGGGRTRHALNALAAVRRAIRAEKASVECETQTGER